MAARASGSRSSTKPSKRQGSGCLLWLVLLLATLLLFVIKWDDIKAPLDATGFVKVVRPKDESLPPAQGDGGLEPQVKPDAPKDTPTPTAPRGTAPQGTPPQSGTPQSGTPQSGTPQSGTPQSGTPQGSGSATRPTGDRPEAKPPAALPVEMVKSTRVAALYFIKVDDDGVITRHEIKRTVAVSDSPMTDALQALMAGPTASELSKGLISLIPSDARLLSAQVRGSTAYLDFNEAFMYNRYGIEGYAGQLKQIVYTATSFSTVKDVQVLIDGKTRDYLGGDGVYIGKPLSRASF